MRIDLARKEVFVRFVYMASLTVLGMLFVSGCGHGDYIPDPLKAKGLGENIIITKPVLISNGQPSDKDHLLDFKGISINYNTFTQSLVEALDMELNKNRAIANDSASKQLEVSVTNVRMDYSFGQLNYRSSIDAMVKMGQSQAKHYQASRASYASGFNMDLFPTKPLDAAFCDLVKKIIEDPEVHGYINK